MNLNKNRKRNKFYFGQIYGKFWFADESIYDPEFFGCEYKKIYRYEQCRCTCTDLNIKYCMNCYSSEIHHQKDAESDNLIMESNELKWTIYFDKIDYVKNKLNEIGSTISIHNYVNNVFFNNEYNYSYIVKDEFRQLDISGLKLMSKWFLGMQIYLCLTKTKSCEFTGEN